MTLEKWQKLSFSEQMGNIGSEFARAKSRGEKKDSEGVKKSLEEAIKLIDLTISTQKKKSRLKEICRLRELTCDLFIGSKNYNVSSDNLLKYTLPFALAARK